MTLAAPASTRSVTVPLIAVVVAGCIIAAITNGIRNSFGLFTLPVTADLGISRETWAMAMAIQNLAWGIAHWDIARLPKMRAIAVSGPAG